MLSNKAKYGLKALLYLGRKYKEDAIQIIEISTNENIPRKFLETILVDLKKHGYVKSKTGRYGGYQLAQKPEIIHLGNVIRILDGPLAPVRCASLTAYLPCTDCKDIDECNVRKLMKEVRDAIADILDNRTLADII